MPSEMRLENFQTKIRNENILNGRRLKFLERKLDKSVLSCKNRCLFFLTPSQHEILLISARMHRNVYSLLTFFQSFVKQTLNLNEIIQIYSL